jgi:hypothetical protein
LRRPSRKRCVRGRKEFRRKSSGSSHREGFQAEEEKQNAKARRIVLTCLILSRNRCVNETQRASRRNQRERISKTSSGQAPASWSTHRSSGQRSLSGYGRQNDKASVTIEASGERKRVAIDAIGDLTAGERDRQFGR